MDGDLSNIDLRLLESFVALARTGSYTRAADEVSLTQSAVYRQIRKLEGQVGAPLVEVDGKRVVLTDVGRIVAEYGERLSQLAQSLEASVESARSGVSGTLAIGSSPSCAEFPLSPALVAFHAANQNVQFRVRVSLQHTWELDRQVADGVLDLAIHSNPSPRSGVIKEPISSEPLVLVAPPGHRFEAFKRIEPDDLADETLIYYDTVDTTLVRALEDEWLGRAEVKPSWWLRVNSHTPIGQLVLSGAGIAIVGERSTFALPRELLVRPLADPPMRDILIAKPARATTGLARRFEAFLRTMEWPARVAR
jgi:DNA-binding transcriptional LysR family regulator